MTESNVRIYQVAHCFKFNNNHYRPPLSPLSLPITEEEGSHPCIPPAEAENIFRNPLEPPPEKLDTILPKGYQTVGCQEVRTYLNKLERRRKEKNTMVKRSTESNLSISRTSQVKVPQERYLTKEEFLTNCRMHTTTPSLLQQSLLPHCNSHSLTQMTQNITLNTTGDVMGHKKMRSNEFSVRKMMNKMKKYQKGWEKQCIVRSNSCQKWKAGSVSHSILKDVVNFRDKMEKKERNLTLQNKELHPRNFGKILRNTSSNCLERPKGQLIVREGISSAGKGKLTKEMAWIDEKDKQGHFFKPQVLALRD